MTTTTTTPTRTVSDDMARLLESRNLASPTVSDKRRISTATITPPPPPPSTRPPKRGKGSISSSDTVTSDSFTATGIHEEAEYIEIPATIESVETYAYIGFDDVTAKRLWATYSDYIKIADPDDPEGEFMDFARWQVENVKFPDATSEDDDWLGYMRAIGVSEELQEGIMLPEYSDIRYTASCQFWLLDTMEMRYGSLLSLDERLRARTTHLGMQKSFNYSAGPTRSPVEPAIGIEEKPLQLSLAKDDFPGVHTLPLEDEEASPELAVGVRTAPVSIAGCTILWRGGSKEKAESFYNPKTKEINLSAIASKPGDFSGVTVLAYWTPQKETANRYASWAKAKSPECEVCIIQVAVPESFTNSISIKYLWSDETRQPTDEWKKLIWHSRRAATFPEELDYLDQKDLLIGHIASGKLVNYVRMSDYTKIRESDLLTVEVDGGERRAIQWVFHTANAQRGFMEHCKDRIWLHNLGAKRSLKQKNNDDDDDDDDDEP